MVRVCAMSVCSVCVLTCGAQGGCVRVQCTRVCIVCVCVCVCVCSVRVERSISISSPKCVDTFWGNGNSESVPSCGRGRRSWQSQLTSTLIQLVLCILSLGSSSMKIHPFCQHEAGVDQARALCVVAFIISDPVLKCQSACLSLLKLWVRSQPGGAGF